MRVPFGVRAPMDMDLDMVASMMASRALPLPSRDDNRVVSTKYSLINFVPKILAQQFARPMNKYFLLVAILQLFPEITPVNPWSTWFPLLVIFSLYAIKEYLDDQKRSRQDERVNNRLFTILDHLGMKRTIKSCEIRQGDKVMLTKGQVAPCDMMILASAHPKGQCLIDTASIDGESGQKSRKAIFEGEPPQQGYIECGEPNQDIESLDAVITYKAEDGLVETAANLQNCILCNCVLCNFEWVVGIAIYTGNNTKLGMCKTTPPDKIGHIDTIIDRLIIATFCLQLCLVLTFSICSHFWDYTHMHHYYLDFKRGDFSFYQFFLTFLRFELLCSMMIPISLKVQLDFSKFSYARFVEADQLMDSAEVSCSTIGEQLCKVEVILSDKTGTLTQNCMEFLKVSIAGVSYGKGMTEIQRGIAMRKGKSLPEEEENTKWEAGFNFSDDRLMDGNWKSLPDKEIILEFFRLLALCHTVHPEGDPSIESIQYQAASPDEAALVVAAKKFGFFFHTRSTRTVTVTEQLPDGEDREYEILAILEFSSKRKRMSVIVRNPEDKLMLYCKGADNVIYERLSIVGNEYKDNTLKDLENFGSEGLRTLCCACREISVDEYQEWAAQFEAAKKSIVDRQKKLDEVAELIEKNLIVIGCTAIEDKLQNGVPESIETLSNAGIKIWVLTGDKVETAISIGYASALLTSNQYLFVINSETLKIQEAEKCMNKSEYLDVLNNEIMFQLQGACDEAKLFADSSKFALVIDGKALQVALKPQNAQLFSELGLSCDAVLCCRLSPLQKADITLLVKRAGLITLAVGDGANDVGMIQSAHIGVGICGNEGMQAARAADYTLSKFRLLIRLLFVHGHYAYHRSAFISQYNMYKSALLCFGQLSFATISGFSGISLFDAVSLMTYNVFYTFLPAFMYILDKDVDIHVLLKNPDFYRKYRENGGLSYKSFTCWLGLALWSSVVIALICFQNVQSSHEDLNIEVYSCILWVQPMLILYASNTWTTFQSAVIVLSVMLYYPINMLLAIIPFLPGSHRFLSVTLNADYWLIIILSTTLCMLPLLLWKAFQNYTTLSSKCVKLKADTISDTEEFDSIYKENGENGPLLTKRTSRSV